MTWGAGGSTRRKTIDLVSRIQQEAGLTAMAHLTCVGAERARSSARSSTACGTRRIENVLGRCAATRPRTTAGLPACHPDGFRHANELLEFIHTRWSFCTPAACYPETHIEAPSPEADLQNLMRKVEAGADFLITQLFFDNADYFAFLERARAAGIGVPIVAGIMPITGTTNVPRIAKMCGARIPDELQAAIDAAGGDPERTDAVGVAWATLQCRELLERNVPGIHFYTLNRSPATRRIHESLFPG